MKKQTWRRHHKWFGLVMGFFLVMFCWSGIVLNHRQLVAGADISRKWLPNSYRFKDWNGGLVRGELVDSASGKVYIYGNAGVFETSLARDEYKSFSDGMPEGVDNRNVRSMAMVGSNGSPTLLCLTTTALYRANGGSWQEVDIYSGNISSEKNGEIEKTGIEPERLSDLEVAGDTVIVVGRSHLFRAVTDDADGGLHFERLTLPAPPDSDGKVTLFRTLWTLHSGEMFGTLGKVLMDCVALILIILYITGVIFWFAKPSVRRGGAKGTAEQPKKVVRPSALRTSLLRHSYKWHDIIGRKTIVLTLFVCLTGWCLRPPLMILGVLTRVSPIPYTVLDSPNAWADKLRALRYDADRGDWLLSSSEGFYSLASLTSVPAKIEVAPPVSVMGINVLRREGGVWLVGSMRGLFVWHRASGSVVDYFSGCVPEVGGMPLGDHAVCGWMADAPVDYSAGSAVAEMPNWMAALPMSLWNVALEVHTGRIYTFMGSLSTLLWVFLAGAGAVWVIWTGRKIS